MNPLKLTIELKNLTKSYPQVRNQPGLKEWLLYWKKFYKKEARFVALNNINLQVHQGECLGVIGHNGAGKSTLLSLLLGTTYPTMGQVLVYGKRTPLLELGAGFHPDLTGRENVLMNAVLLGLTKKEALGKQDEIIKFSEIESFIDMPVRTYSSGMYIRLAFSVAIHTNPETLLIDEILAVGDESFQKKSEEALTKLIKSGVTTVFVSHNMAAIKKICSRAIWVDHGKIKEDGDPTFVTERYLSASK